MPCTRSRNIDPESRGCGRKRRPSSPSRAAESSHEHSTTSSNSADNMQGPEQVAAVRTPRRAKKRVRFSDPGPQLLDLSNHDSTGLTPAILRTSFEEYGDTSEEASIPDQTPSRASRRPPTPRTLRPRRSLDSVLPLSADCSSSSSSEHVFQWTPLRQILDSRTQRRIRRVGLSAEITKFERERRDAAKLERTLADLRRRSSTQDKEITRLRLELDSRRDAASLVDGEASSPCSVSGASCFSRGYSVSSPMTQPDCGEVSGEIIMMDDSGIQNDTMFVSDSPEFRPSDADGSQLPTELSLLNSRTIGADASTQACIPDDRQEAEFASVSQELETAKREKQQLFEAWRARVSSQTESNSDGHVYAQLSSPPPDFFEQVTATLSKAFDRASDAVQALDTVHQELRALGFAGADASEIIEGMRSSFRSARLELERAVPGETANVALTDGYATLRALVHRVQLLVKGLGEEQTRHHGAIGREKALRGEFDAVLGRYEAATKKIKHLEETIASSAGDMLHTRMRMQELEREGKDQALGIDRLNSALNKYRNEVKGLESLITRLEADNETRKAQYEQQISDLQGTLSTERESHKTRIHELEDIVEQNRIRVCDLTAKVESLEKERLEAVNLLAQQAAQEAQRHESEMGSMNVRISELTTSLEDSKSEMERLKQINAGLEEQLQLEIRAKDELLDSWVAQQARSLAYVKERVNTERRQSKVRAANWKIQSDEIHSDSSATAFGSEPITPVSMTRFVDVEVGRGKRRRRLDSGIGILTEDELLGDEEEEEEVELPGYMDATC